jgi:hypothetical protein
MRHEPRPWLAITPWSQIMGADGQPWTVMPHWPAHQKRITRRGAAEYVFTPRPMDMATVLVPDDADALATLAAAFGGPPEVTARWTAPASWWECPQQTEPTVLAHLRDWHATLEPGSPSARLTHSNNLEALGYHWQLHQQQLVFPLPVGHVHT